MHPEIQQNEPGTCPICGGMKLVPQDSIKESSSSSSKGFAQYKPLFVIVGLIALASATAAWNQGRVDSLAFMQNFMAGFFLVFSGFKLLDIKGFAEGYSQYDLLAKHWHSYGLLYPFIELGLGLSYLLWPMNENLHIATLVLMTFGGIGVTIKVVKKEKFQCACLGTFIDVPLTYITIVEDFGMALMAAAMLLQL